MQGLVVSRLYCKGSGGPDSPSAHRENRAFAHGRPRFERDFQVTQFKNRDMPTGYVPQIGFPATARLPDTPCRDELQELRFRRSVC
jgi:hypothetical protein